VRRYPVLLTAVMVLLLAAVPRLRALTDEEKKEQFLEARGEDESTASPTPSPSPHHKKHPEAEPTPHHKRSPSPEPEVTPHHKHHDAEEPAETPSPEPQATALSQPFQPNVQTYGGPAVTPLPYPRATPAPTPPPGPLGVQGVQGPQVDVEKEGLEEQGGLEPPPPPVVHHHWWQIFGGGEEPQYHYLTKEIRDAIDRAPVARHRWRFIVVHNSGTRQGNARIFDYYHRYVRKMPNGLAYHFVIGNGTSSGNGQIEIGGRWIKQLQGGHVHSDYLNNIALGICLVGDFNRDLPTKEQLEALDELIRYLRIRVGKIDRKPAIVKAHKEINPPQWPTDCPGDRFPYHWLHERFD